MYHTHFEEHDIHRRALIAINIAIAILVAAVLAGVAAYRWFDGQKGRPATAVPPPMFFDEGRPGR